jgi:protein-tyrosine phosphatase
MAAAMLADRLAHAEVRSAGVSARSGGPPPGDVVAVMRAFGLDISAHRSRTLDAPIVEGADLVVAMTLEHLREVVVLAPKAGEYSFTLKELARRAAAGGRRPGHARLRDWLRLLAADRDLMDLLGRSAVDDIDDPVGMPRAAIRRTAVELRGLVDQVVDCLWPS